MDNKILDEMYKRKAEYKDCFATALLLKDAPAREQNERTDKWTHRTIKAGTKVLITMVSSFGDAGIRDYDIEEKAHGYISRVDPNDLDDVKFL